MTEGQFKYQARVHLAKMIVIFSLSLVAATASFQVEEWTEHFHSHTWKPIVVSIVFYSIGTISAFISIFIGSGIYEWFRTYKIAKRDLCDSTPQSSLSTEMSIDMEQVHKKMYTVVIGPIPWK